MAAALPRGRRWIRDGGRAARCHRAHLRRRAQGAAQVRKLWIAAAALLAANAAQAETVNFGRFGDITLYRGEKPTQLVLFLSGDGGWNLGVVSMAERLAEMHALVAGIDIRHYLAELEAAKQSCVSPAEDLKELGAHLAADLKLDAPAAPTLVGYSS